ncbi:MAG TPA: DNA replication and repair protein RecF [Chitinophagales bacterium]|nr:DNA replication and repair protein RecF [Chitinophagales bacterium]
MYVYPVNLLDVSLTQFRNYAAAKLRFCDGINCITGLNGTGKTNLLEAVYYLCVGKGFFTGQDVYNVQRERDYFRLEGKFQSKQLNDSTIQLHEDTVAVYYHVTQGKTLFRNGVKYNRLAEHVGRYPVVVIEPEDTWLIAEGGEARRKMIDNVISQVNDEYLEKLIQYNRVLVQRNSLLKQMAETRDWNESLVTVYDEQLEPLANFLHDCRNALVKSITPVLEETYQAVSGQREAVGITYVSDIGAQNFFELMRNSRGKDRALQRTSRGTHRDDFELTMNGVAIKKYGSQGQKKSSMIALKLSFFRWIKNQTHTFPMLLLDDIFDKLDPERTTSLFRLIDSPEFAQVFITDTDAERIKIRLDRSRKPVKFLSLPLQS